jgi:peptidoglycan/xylan/chitin deacetylase (PgdA/CDA1 family)
VSGAPTVCFTVDYEPDCPPYLSSTHRGVEEATAPLLAMLAELGVPATWFSTGEVAERYPDAVRAVVAAGHELGCHGHTHRRFDALGEADARDEIAASSAVLRRFAPVDAFRAPNLSFPDAYLPLLAGAGYRLDSSAAKYKAPYWRARLGRASRPPAALRRIPASATSSVLRLPRPVRGAYLAALASPVVLFVHPWEFVDLTRERLRLDCRFHTGPEAFRRVRAVLDGYRRRGARFLTMREAAAAGAAADAPAAARGDADRGAG